MDTQPSAHLQIGTQGVLPCRSDAAKSLDAVFWVKTLPSSAEKPIVHLQILGTNRGGPGYEDGSFNISDDFSLVIKSLRVQDEGRYICQAFHSGSVFKNYTDLRVFGKLFIMKIHIRSLGLLDVY